MADQNIQALPISALIAGTEVLSTDTYPAVDTTDHTQSPTGTTKKYTISQLSEFLSVLSWNDVIATPQALAGNNGYVTDNGATLITYTLPTVIGFGDIIKVDGKSAGGWKITQNAGQQILFGNNATTLGVTGGLASTNAGDCVTLLCVVANITFIVIDCIGNLSVLLTSTTNNSINAPFPFSLAIGGTNNNLTASNGGLVYSDASKLEILSGTPTANLIPASGSNAAPSWKTLSALIDANIGNTQGDILFRNATEWTVLAPGTTGDFLQTQGAGDDPLWATPTGSGTVDVGSTNEIAYYVTNGNEVSGLPTANNGVLTTDNTGAPHITNVLPAGLTLPQPIIQGITTGTPPASGQIGEIFESVIPFTAPVSITGGLTPANLTLLNLPIGNFRLSANAGVASTSITAFQAGISTSSATFPNLEFRSIQTSSASGNQADVVPGFPIFLSTPTTYYLVVGMTGTGSPVAYGGLYAERIS